MMLICHVSLWSKIDGSLEYPPKITQSAPHICSPNYRYPHVCFQPSIESYVCQVRVLLYGTAVKQTLSIGQSARSHTPRTKDLDSKKKNHEVSP